MCSCCSGPMNDLCGKEKTASLTEHCRYENKSKDWEGTLWEGGGKVRASPPLEPCLH